MVCFLESFASLGEGIENALWELGGVPQLHGTDRLTAVVNNVTEDAELQRDYQALLRHYRMEGRKIHARRHISGSRSALAAAPSAAA